MAEHDKDIDALIERIKQFYDEFSVDRLDGLDTIYTEDVGFTDPIHQVTGLADLRNYFRGVMDNVEYCHFAFTEQACTGEWLFLAWQMRFAHPKLANGREIVMPGVSQFHLHDGKVRTQQDHYDMGAMLYEHVPVLGFVVNKIKQRLANS